MSLTSRDESASCWVPCRTTVVIKRGPNTGAVSALGDSIAISIAASLAASAIPDQLFEGSGSSRLSIFHLNIIVIHLLTYLPVAAF